MTNVEQDGMLVGALLVLLAMLAAVGTGCGGLASGWMDHAP